MIMSKRWFRYHRILRRQSVQRGEFVATSSPDNDCGRAATGDAVRIGDARAANAVKQLYVLFFVEMEHPEQGAAHVANHISRRLCRTGAGDLRLRRHSRTTGVD